MVFCLGDELDGLLPRVPNPRLNGQIFCCLNSRGGEAAGRKWSAGMRWKAGPPTTIAGLSGGQGSGSFHPHRKTLTHETPAFRCRHVDAICTLQEVGRALLRVSQ